MPSGDFPAVQWFRTCLPVGQGKASLVGNQDPRRPEQLSLSAATAEPAPAETNETGRRLKKFENKVRKDYDSASPQMMVNVK